MTQPCKTPSAQTATRLRRIARHALLLLLFLTSLLALLPFGIQWLAPRLLEAKSIQVEQLNCQWQGLSLEVSAILKSPEFGALSVPSLNLRLSRSLTLQVTVHEGALDISNNKKSPSSAPNILSRPTVIIPFDAKITDFTLAINNTPPYRLNAHIKSHASTLFAELELSHTTDAPAQISFQLDTKDGQFSSDSALPLPLLQSWTPTEAQPWLNHQLDLHCQGVYQPQSQVPPFSRGECSLNLSGTIDNPHPWSATATLNWQPGAGQLQRLMIQRPVPLPQGQLRSIPSHWRGWLPHQLQVDGQLTQTTEGLQANSALTLQHPEWQAVLNPTLQPDTRFGRYRLALPVQAYKQATQLEAQLAFGLNDLTAHDWQLLPDSQVQIKSLQTPTVSTQELTFKLLQQPLSLNIANDQQAKIELNFQGIRYKKQPLPDLKIELLARALQQTEPYPFHLALPGPLHFQGTYDRPRKHLTINSKTVDARQIEALLRPLKLWPKPLSISSGRASSQLAITFNDSPSGQLKLRFDKISGHYKEILFSELSSRTRLPFTHGVFKGNRNQVTLNRLDIGLPMTQLRSQFQLSGAIQDPIINLSDLSLNTLGGQINATELPINPHRQKSGIIELKQLDLSQLIALYNQPGVFASGQISGSLPLQIDRQGVKLEHGQLYAQPPGGFIKINASPAIEELKRNQSSLKFAFELMENLHYHTLAATVDLQRDGEMVLATQIKGANPARLGGQEIHFNYHHQENIFQLLKSLQLADEINSGLDSYFNPSP